MALRIEQGGERTGFGDDLGVLRRAFHGRRVGTEGVQERVVFVGRTLGVGNGLGSAHHDSRVGRVAHGSVERQAQIWVDLGIIGDAEFRQPRTLPQSLAVASEPHEQEVPLEQVPDHLVWLAGWLAQRLEQRCAIGHAVRARHGERDQSRVGGHGASCGAYRLGAVSGCVNVYSTVGGIMPA